MIILKTLLEKMRDINRIIQKAAGHPISFVEMAENLSKSISANVYIVGRKGKVLGYTFMENFYCPTMEEIVKPDAHFPDDYTEDLLRSNESTVNISRGGQCVFGIHSSCFLEDKYTTYVPIIGGAQRLGTLMLSKSGKFDESDLILAEYGSTIIGMEILRARVEKMEEINRQKAIVGVAFDTLSYSELEAVEHIFTELGESNGLLVASKIADKVGITRSVIVNALRKLESAGVVEVRSLGMKGTYIRILNDFLLEELDRIKATHHRY
ncbi:MAG: GTP-sensing pleiotropic transcriptional regulator CodY [Clostridiales bacterium]|jgi:transcriptional pleiotropic repressor|nr:GTP-sensing pleiotropic transcriptional regulator CodY [Clostridiales bacterium]MDR2712585.1 GTP-sensing pleiotropic transcriptional regulator CodY [Clostridiales bacterium]